MAQSSDTPTSTSVSSAAFAAINTPVLYKDVCTFGPVEVGGGAEGMEMFPIGATHPLIVRKDILYDMGEVGEAATSLDLAK